MSTAERNTKPLVIMDEDGYYFRLFPSGVAVSLSDEDLANVPELRDIREAGAADKRSQIVGNVVTLCELVDCARCDDGKLTGDVFVYPEDDCGTHTVPAEYASSREWSTRHKVIEDAQYDCRECGGFGRVYEAGKRIIRTAALVRLAA